MSLSAIANLIRLRPGPVNDRGLPVMPARDGRTLLSRAEPPVRTPAVSHGPATAVKSLLVGLDFGADRTRVLARLPGLETFYLRRSLPTALSRLKPDDPKAVSPYLHVGDDALGKGERFEVIRPWAAGDLVDAAMARELVRHVREWMRKSEQFVCRAVVAEPLTLSEDGRHHLRQALRGLFEQVVFLPRPYLTALGWRSQSGTTTPAPADHETWLVDAGAGATEICRIGVHYPVPAEMNGVPFGGTDVIRLVGEALRQEYPMFRPSALQLRHWVEEFGFVGEPASSVAVKVMVDGVERELALTNSLRRGCETWLLHMQQLIQAAITSVPGRAARTAEIVLTGGGSRINQLVPMLGSRLTLTGLQAVKVSLADDGEYSLASVGALHAAQLIRADQWPAFAF